MVNVDVEVGDFPFTQEDVGPPVHVIAIGLKFVRLVKDFDKLLAIVALQGDLTQTPLADEHDLDHDSS